MSSIQDGERLTMLPLPLCLCHGVMARKAKQNWEYMTAEARNVLEESDTKNWQEVSEIKNSKRLTMSPNQLIEGLWLQKTLKGFASEVLGEGEGRTYLFFLFFFLFFFFNLRQRGFELSTVGLGLTWATRCSCLPRRDRLRLRHGT